MDIQEWLPLSPDKGPPFPAFLKLYWPWYTPGGEIPDGEIPEGWAPIDIVWSAVSLNPDVLILPGTVKNPGAAFPVSPAGMACTGELYLSKDGGVTKAATSGAIEFTSTGVNQTVTFPITVPAPGGYAYQAYLVIMSEGQVLGQYIGTDKVNVPSVGTPTISW
ncbi:MAG: hypothetical protein PHI12_06895 [Dehalococcoidales bacterium]|nr:hypothetical protein [Dehalococcoidales bacterium]